MAVPLEKFVQQLEDSGILAGDTIKDFIPPKATPKDATELARELVRMKKLTKFQAEEVSRGKGKSLVLGNYVLMEKIGAGGMGQVFKAEHRRMKRVVAIKLLPPNVTKDQAAIARFEREVEAAAKLRHPNIVAADDADCANGVHFLVMELVEGSDLSALVKKNGPFSIEKAVNYVLQAAKGLEFAHKKGIVHRDIKPSNLLLDSEGTIKVLDMGLARLSGDADDPVQHDLTSTGTIMGTADYMPPEQALDTKTADARADIYALGCSLYYLLTGKAAYEGNTLMAKLLAHRDNPIPSLRAANPQVTEQLEAVFKKMVAKKVEDRCQNMSEVISVLGPCGSDNKSSQALPKSSITQLDRSTVTFQKNLPDDPTIVVKAGPNRSGKGNQKLLYGVIVLAFLGVLLAGIIVSLKTNDGMLVVEVDQSDANIQVLDAEGKVEISQKGGKGLVSISVDPGKHRLKVEKEGFTVFGQDFEMNSGGNTPITAKLVPLEKNPAMVGTKPVVAGAKKPLFFQTQGYEPWAKEVATMPAEKQVEAVSKKLIELNPGFDGKVTHHIDNGADMTVSFVTDKVTDISPARALSGLKNLECGGSEIGKGKLIDISPLKGMPLTQLAIHNNGVADLSPLIGIPLSVELRIEWTQVSDLSPLKGMPLKQLNLWGALVSDHSPLKGMPLKTLYCDFIPERDTELLRSIKTLETINGKPAAEFLKKVDEQQKKNKQLFFQTPEFDQWAKEVTAMPAEKQVEAVSKKLVELNPGFDGKVTPTFEEGVATGLQFLSDDIADISPVRALVGLWHLSCGGTTGNSKFKNLAPLKGLSLKTLACPVTNIADLSALSSMPLVYMDVSHTLVSDLTPLKTTALTQLSCYRTAVSDLEPVRGMPLTFLNIGLTRITDLDPLQGMPLKEVAIDFRLQRDTKLLRSISTLAQINGQPAIEFWKDVAEASDPSTTLKDPAFQQWLKNVSTLTPEEQVEAVSKKLVELNPSFDGMVQHKIDNGVVTELKFISDKVWNIAPVRVLVGLKSFDCSGSQPNGRLGKIGDLSPLIGMKLTALRCVGTSVFDLSPLRGMPLNTLVYASAPAFDLTPLQGMPLYFLDISLTPVSDLNQIKGLPLTHLVINGTLVRDLAPLRAMTLRSLFIQSTRISDLLPMEGMQLVELGCDDAQVSDLSPIKSQPLRILSCDFKPERDAELLRSIKTLEKINGKPVAEFWKEVEEQQKGKKLGFQMPGFDQWVKDVHAMPAEQQVEAVSKKLMELNPGFDGKLGGPSLKSGRLISDGTVTQIDLATDHITDISPVRALNGLRYLGLYGTNEINVGGHGQLADLSPLNGMQLSALTISNNPIADLSALKGMAIEYLLADGTQVSDLTPLRGMPLTILNVGYSQVRDLSPLSGMTLKVFIGNSSPVSDISQLAEMPLEHLDMARTPLLNMRSLKHLPLKFLWLDFKPARDTELLRSIKTLETINSMPAAEFWTEVEAYEARAGQPLAFKTPGFDDWVRQVAALTAEEQVKLVASKMKELNPGFDGQLQPTIENGVVVKLVFSGPTHMRDLSPLRALAGLTLFSCDDAGGWLSDLSPLNGMPLTYFSVNKTSVTDLSPLKGMKLNTLSVMSSNVTDLSPLMGLPLSVLNIQVTPVSDLSPLKGMPLQHLDMNLTPVSDISPLKGMPLVTLLCSLGSVTDISPLKDMPLKTVILDFNPERDAGILRSIKTLEQINGKPAAEFWKEVEEQQKGKKLGFQKPGFDQWVKEVASLSAEKQVEAVSKKLMEFNPGFDGKLTGDNVKGTPRIEGGAITSLSFLSDNVKDISPVRALTSLKALWCPGSNPGNGKLSDLSPLRGMELNSLNCGWTQVGDLSPVQGMPLTSILIFATPVADLSPLRGMKLEIVDLGGSQVSDLSPLKDMPLKSLQCLETAISDLSPLAGMKLTEFMFSPARITKGIEVIRQMDSLKAIAPYGEKQPAAEFWKKYDAGEFDNTTSQ